MQRSRKPPRAKANARYRLARNAGRHQRYAPPLACDHEPRARHQPRHLHLDALQRRVHAASRAPRIRFLRQHVPRLQRLPKLKLHTLSRYGSNLRKPKLHVRPKPVVLKRNPRRAHIPQHVLKVFANKMRQHEPVMQPALPPHELRHVRLLPEDAHQRPHQQHLQQVHPEVRSHLERSQLQQPQPQTLPLRRKHLIDAELRPMRISRDIHQQITKQSVDDMRRTLAPIQLAERDLQLVQRIHARFIHPRILTRRPHIHPRK